MKNMRIKKLLTIFTTCAILATSLYGCGNSSTTTQTSTSNEKKLFEIEAYGVVDPQISAQQIIADKKGFFDKLSDIVTGLIGTEGTLTNLTSSLKDKSKIIQSQKDKVQATLDKKYAMMQKQFSTIAVQMNALENSFNSLKNTFDALLNSNK